MKANQLFLMLIVLIEFFCTTKQEDHVIENKLKQDIHVPVQVTVISNLPDSLQPKTVFLDKMPAPRVVAISQSGGQAKMLPVLQNENGETILDDEGKPYIMGDGGKSNFTNFTTDNGLALDAVSCSLLDKFGNLWFGTLGGGVSRYDGQSFSTFTTAQGLANNSVWSITEDNTGNLWFGTLGGGVSRYDGKSFSTFTTAQGLANNSVRSITKDNTGNLWFGTQGGGVSRYNGKSFSTFTTAQGLAHNFVWSITEDNTGNLWFGTDGGGVSRYDGESFSTFTIAQGLANNVVRSITEDNTGNLWFGTFGGGVSRYDGKSFSTFTTAQGLAHNSVRSITEDNTGNLWFGTVGGGVSRYDGKSFSTFTTAQGLANNQVWSITEDNTGNLWFGTFGGGVSRYDGKSFSTFTTAQGLAHNSVRSITEDNTGNLWFGTAGGGVSRYDGKSFSTFTTAQGLANNQVWSITEDKTGNLWFGTGGGGVSRYDGKSFSTFTIAQGLAHNVVSITEDKTGNLWFGTGGGGTSRYDGKSFSTFTTAQGLAHNSVWSITEDNTGNLWFGTFGGGISRYDGKSFSTFTTAQGLANNFVRSITRDNMGNLWFGTIEGLSVMRAGDVRMLAENNGKKIDIISSTMFKSFKIADGLPDNVVTQVIQMSDGKMAVGTNLGITLFNPSDDFTKLTDIEIYNSNTGYPVKDLNPGQNTMFLDSKGILWAGTGSEKTALVRFDPAALKTNMEAPTLVVQSIKVNDENIPWYDLNETPVALDSITTPAYVTEEVGLFGRELTVAERDSLQKRFEGIQFDGIRPFYPVPEKLVLPHEHNHISFEFAAIETSRPFMVKYQYMLEGYDKDWSPLTSRSNATFGNISEGTYTFKLKAQGANGVWTDPVTYTFKVLPPWWRSWWAYALYIIGFVSAVYLIILWRTKALQKEKELLEVKVSERTTELKTSLENLKSTQSQLIQSEKMASLGELTAGIAHEIQNPLNFINNFSEINTDLLHELKGKRLTVKGERDDQGETEILNDIEENEKKITLHGKRADAIVKGMLQHSQRNVGVKEATDINALAEEYLRLAYHGFRAKNPNFSAELKLDLDPALPFVNVIPQDIGRVFLNSFNNALWFVGEKFKSRGDLESPFDLTGHQPFVSLTTKNLTDHIEIRIKDNGPGIPQNIVDKIFQPFFTTKPTGQGTGLGLSLAYDIVKAHGGTLEVKSVEGAGSEFIFSLPI